MIQCSRGKRVFDPTELLPFYHCRLSFFLVLLFLLLLFLLLLLLLLCDRISVCLSLCEVSVGLIRLHYAKNVNGSSQ